MGKNPNAHRAFTGKHQCEENEIIRQWLAWAFLELAAGRPVTLWGIGKLYLRWRPGRAGKLTRPNGEVRIVEQPDTWAVKIKSSTPLRKSLVKLAETVRPETTEELDV